MEKFKVNKSNNGLYKDLVFEERKYDGQVPADSKCDSLNIF